MTTRGLASSAVAVFLLVSRAASAQSQYTAQSTSPTWLKDRQYTQGIGVRTGDLEIHPGIGGEFGYDSNYFMRSTTLGVANGPPDAPVIPALQLRITPSLYLSTITAPRYADAPSPTPPSIAFRAGVNATYQELIGISSDSTASSKSSNSASDQRNVGGSADARLDIAPARPVNGAVYASFARALQPNTVAANPDLSFNSDTVGAGAEIGFQPNSGTLDWHFGYNFRGTFFETTDGELYNNLTHQAYTQGRWKFRPRTALIYDGTASFVTYPNLTPASDVPLDASTPIRTRIGLEGLVTDRFAVTALIGWGASFYEFNPRLPSRPQFDSIIAKGEVRWYLSASPGIAKAADLGLTLSSIALGYTRDFQNSFLGSYDTQDRGYLKFNYMFAGRALLSLEGGVTAIEYPTLFWNDNTVRNASFTDARADVTLFGEYRFTDTLGLNSTLRYTSNISTTTLPISEHPLAGSINKYDMAWQRFEAYIGLRWFM